MQDMLTLFQDHAVGEATPLCRVRDLLTLFCPLQANVAGHVLMVVGDGFATDEGAGFEVEITAPAQVDDVSHPVLDEGISGRRRQFGQGVRSDVLAPVCGAAVGGGVASQIARIESPAEGDVPAGAGAIEGDVSARLRKVLWRCKLLSVLLFCIPLSAAAKVSISESECDHGERVVMGCASGAD